MYKLRLKDLREDSDTLQKEISEYLNISQQLYSLYENNKRQIPIDILIKAAFYFNTSTDYLLGITNVSKPYPKIINFWHNWHKIKKTLCQRYQA